MEATIDELRKKMASGEISSRGLVSEYLTRIARVDGSTGGLNSVLEINPDAASIAESLDVERVRKGTRGPLHGIPVIVKDNIDTADKMHTSAGSRALADSYALKDSFVAHQLRKAGAVILGKANMTEWANFMTVGMPAGYSSRGGQVRNPYGPFSPGGSSSGSGASVSANLCAIAVGTETSGSILSPAHQNSVVGIKPTVGLVSRSGIIPIMFSQDTAGPLARTVTDAAILLGALAGVDESDPVTLASEGRSSSDYTRYLDAGALRGARLGVPREVWSKAPEEAMPVLEKALLALRAAGAVVVDPAPMPAANDILGSTPAMMYEFKPALNAYLKELSPWLPVHSLRELIAFNYSDPSRMLRYGQALLLRAEATSGRLVEPEYLVSRARDVLLAGEQGIDRLIADNKLDAVLMPGSTGAGIAARAGYPSVCVPAGYAASGQPVGVTFTAGAYSEPTLIALAYAYEQATAMRKPPALANQTLKQQ